MKRAHFLAVLILFVASLTPSLALISVGNVSKERAKELGIELRAKPGGPKHAWIELEFKAEGKLASFQHVSLEIAEGDELGLGWTPLKDKRTHRGSVLVRVMGSRAFLKKVTLRIVYGDFGGSGDDVRIKDFVDFDQLDKPEPSKESGNAKEDGADKPAAADEAKSEAKIWTPTELVSQGGKGLWDSVTKFVVEFRVASIRLVRTTYPNGETRQVPHLVASDGVDFTAPNFTVRISQEVEASLKRIGIANLDEHFTGKTVMIRGTVSRTGLMLIGSETRWTFQIHLRSLDQLLEMTSGQKKTAEEGVTPKL